MRAAARNLVVAVTLLAFTGCAATRTLETLTPATIREQVEPGDVVKVAVNDGRSFEIEVEKVEATALTGTTLENRRYRIPYSTITSLQVQGDRAGAAAGAGAMIIIGTVVVLAAVIGFGEEILDCLTGRDCGD